MAKKAAAKRAAKRSTRSNSEPEVEPPYIPPESEQAILDRLLVSTRHQLSEAIMPFVDGPLPSPGDDTFPLALDEGGQQRQYRLRRGRTLKNLEQQRFDLLLTRRGRRYVVYLARCETLWP